MRALDIETVRMLEQNPAWIRTKYASRAESEIGAEFASFNFTNPLICEVVSRER